MVRASSLYLSSVDLVYSGRSFTYTDSITMNHSSLCYTKTISSKATAVIVMLYAESSTATITVNDVTVASGKASVSIPLPTASTTISIKVSNMVNVGTRDCSVIINKN